MSSFTTLPAELADLMIHSSPAWVTLAIVALSWQRAWIAGIAIRPGALAT